MSKFKTLLNQTKKTIDKIKFEIKWRWEDIKHEHTTHLPPEPGEEDKDFKIPLKEWPGIFYRAAKLTARDVKDDATNIYKFIRGIKEKEEEQEDYQQEEDKSMIQQRNNNLQQTQNNTQQQQNKQVNDFENVQIKLQHFIRTRFLLIQTCIRQFLIGYNEGMGRNIDTETLKKKKALTEMIGGNVFNKEEWFNKVRTVAGGFKKIKEEMNGITDLKEDELLKSDLEDAKRIELEDQEKLFNKIDVNNQQSIIKEETTMNVGYSTSVVVDAPSSQEPSLVKDENSSVVEDSMKEEEEEDKEEKTKQGVVKRKKRFAKQI
ncbi:hypothetical protein ABK040_013539 [Willaertia magna]